MIVFVDTTALYAFIDQDDEGHHSVLRAWDGQQASAMLSTTNYVVVEAAALLQSRIGLGAVTTLMNEIVPVLQIDWVTPELHETAVEALFASNRRDLSLVDCVSFLTMRRLGISQCSLSTAILPSRGLAACRPNRKTYRTKASLASRLRAAAD